MKPQPLVTAASLLASPLVNPTPGAATRIQPMGPDETTEETPMPRGRPRKDPNAAPTEAPKKRGPKPGQKRTRKDGQPIGAASFVIDDRGGMEIRDGQQVIQLERDDVKRLCAFLDRTKGIRA